MPELLERVIVDKDIGIGENDDRVIRDIINTLKNILVREAVPDNLLINLIRLRKSLG